MVTNEMAPSEDPLNKAEAPFSIRRMRPEDYGTVAAIWKAAHLPHQPQGRDSEMRVREQLEKDISLYLVAESEGEVIGSLLVTHDLRKGWLNRLAVRQDRQGRGVASSLERRRTCLPWVLGSSPCRYKDTTIRPADCSKSWGMMSMRTSYTAPEGYARTSEMVALTILYPGRTYS
ncbi:MAG: GNAT family N-acetyltransferase [Methanomassiliicoccus sp.]|nr:MAG: GNAT family N-acetyltransferase [Methanomassiliicoccus sp.]